MIRTIYRQRRDLDGVVQDACVIHFQGHATPVIVPARALYDPRGSVDSPDALQAAVDEELGCHEPLSEFRGEAGWLESKRRVAQANSLSIRLSQKCIGGIVNVLALFGEVEAVRVETHLSACAVTIPPPERFGFPASFDLEWCLRNCFGDVVHVLASRDGRLVLGGAFAARLLRAGKDAVRRAALATTYLEGE